MTERNSFNEVTELLQLVAWLTELQAKVGELTVAYEKLAARVEVLSQKARKAHPSAGNRPIVNIDDYRNGGKTNG